MSNENTSSSENADIRIDDTGIFITLRTHAPLAGKVLIVLGGLFFFTPLVLFALNDTGPMIGPLLIYGAGWSLVIGRMILWNLFGEERIAITKQYIEFQRSYGLIQTGTHKHPLHGFLTIGIIHRREKKGIQYGRMEFITTNETGRQTPILKTGVHLPQKQIDYIISATISLLDRTARYTF